MNWIIKDWMGNDCFDGQLFGSFEDGEEFLNEYLDGNYELDRGEYYIEREKHAAASNC
jgi:hypothetical protein